MNYLGIDFGEKHLGIAIASGSLAEPLTTTSTAKSLQLIKRLVINQSIDGIIIGMLENTTNPDFESFVREVSTMGIPVYFYNEALSSHDAREALLHTSPTRRKKLEHSVAATIILQGWLDEQNLKKQPLSV